MLSTLMLRIAGLQPHKGCETHSFMNVHLMAENNQYLPKYIQNIPWYYKNDALASADDALYHHRKKPGEKLDHSDPQAGSGIKDNFESVDGHLVRSKIGIMMRKGDRWHGHSHEEWDEIFEKWDKNQKRANIPLQRQDSDEADYELELEELGLDRKQNSKFTGRKIRWRKAIYGIARYARIHL